MMYDIMFSVIIQQKSLHRCTNNLQCNNKGLQALNQTELQNWPSTAVQKDNAFSFSQGNTTDKDIPF